LLKIAVKGLIEFMGQRRGKFTHGRYAPHMRDLFTTLLGLLLGLPEFGDIF
jgi:hypothetical protein